MIRHRYWMFIGNSAKPPHQQIFVSEFDAAIPLLGKPQVAAPAERPNFLAVHPDARFLYAVTAATCAGNSGAVEAFAINGATGELAFLNRQPSGGENPAHLVVHPSGQWLLVANYGGGTVAVLPIEPSGKLGEATQVVVHKGSSVHAERQTKPYPHGITLDAAGTTAFVCDLGTDSVEIYRMDAVRGSLTPAGRGVLPPGSGPRHLVLSKDGRFAYVINELTSTIAVMERHGDSLQMVQVVSPWSPILSSHTGAEIELHPNGRFLYASNRGHDSLAICEVDAGRLTVVGLQPTLGQTPRHFAIDPTGESLLAENLQSDSIVLFRLDPSCGQLTPAGQAVEAHSPLCAVFVQVRA